MIVYFFMIMFFIMFIRYVLPIVLLILPFVIVYVWFKNKRYQKRETPFEKRTPFETPNQNNPDVVDVEFTVRSQEEDDD